MNISKAIKIKYYTVAFFVVVIWSATFVSSKYLLYFISPMELMFARFVCSYAAVLIVSPTYFRPISVRDELLMFAASCTGGAVYFVLENYSLVYTSATNVSLLITTAPIVTMFIVHFARHGAPLNRFNIIGSLIAFFGVYMVITGGSFSLKINNIGDILALGAAFSWAVYCLFVLKIDRRYPPKVVLRRIFFHSAVISLVLMLGIDGVPKLGKFFALPVLLNLLFLGLIAGTVCYSLWNTAIHKIGAVAANNFLYLSPVFTLLLSSTILQEPISPFILANISIVVVGLVVCNYSPKKHT